MASTFEFDTIKAEKADAMRRYKRQRVLTLCLNMAVTSALLWWFFNLTQATSSSVYLSVLNHQLFIFGLINTLVFLIYNFSTSNHTDAVSNHNLYDQYISFSSSRKTQVVSPEPETVQHEEDVILSDKQIVHFQNVAKDQVRDVIVIKTHAVDDTEEKCFKRSKSDKYEKNKRSQRRVLRRSETEINGREMVVVSDSCGDDQRVRKSIKEMNNEEFRLTIESFIASKKKSLRDENFAVLMEDNE